MTEDTLAESNPSSFVFAWGSVRLEISGTPDLIREAFTLVRDDIMPKLGSADANEGSATNVEPRDEARDVQPNADKEQAENAQNGSPADFVRSKEPKTEQEKATVLASYAKAQRGLAEFTVEQLESLYNEAHVTIKNVQNAVWNAGRKEFGWIKRVQGKRGVYYLTPAGESYVKTRLPKVKA